MTKQDYELIAKTISKLNLPLHAWGEVTNAFTIALASAKNNRTFNPERFRQRCAELVR